MMRERRRRRIWALAEAVSGSGSGSKASEASLGEVPIEGLGEGEGLRVRVSFRQSFFRLVSCRAIRRDKRREDLASCAFVMTRPRTRHRRDKVSMSTGESSIEGV